MNIKSPWKENNIKIREVLDVRPRNPKKVVYPRSGRKKEVSI